MSEKMEFRARIKKPRHELSLPQLTFHHADHWMKVLGLEVFSAWLMIYTWCDRKNYPKDDVCHHKNMKNIAEAFGCKVDKAQKILKMLYEFGLIDIIQEKNKYGSMKNVYYWYDIPIYADTTFCELKKCRNWEDRNAHGQELVKLRKIREEKKAIMSRTEKSYGSDNSQENSDFQDEPYEKTVRQPYGKIVHSNVLNNNVVVDVVVDDQQHQNLIQEKAVSSTVQNDGAAFDLSSEENLKDPVDEKAAPNDTTTVTELQQQAEKMCSVQISVELLNNLATEYGVEKVKEKIKMLGSVQTRNAPGFLVTALRDDYVFMPGRPQQQKRASPGGQAVRNRNKAREPGNAEAQARKTLLNSLYLS